MGILKGKIAVITGGRQGIGRGIVDAFIAEGAKVITCGRGNRPSDLPDNVGWQILDVSDSNHVNRFSEDIGACNILVNNAGITRDGLFARMSNDDWDDVMRVNLTSVFRLTKEIAYPMMRRKGGRIINITSIVGVTGNPGQANYCASKAGMIGFTKSLAQEIASRGVTVNCIAPGFISSAMTDKLNDKQKEAIMSAIPMKKMGSGDDIANAALYLASDEGGYVTGQTLHVNGGMAMI